jgi:hypothetical protein
MDLPFFFGPNVFLSPVMLFEGMLLAIVNTKINIKFNNLLNEKVTIFVKEIEAKLIEHQISNSDELYINFSKEKEIFIRKMASLK